MATYLRANGITDEDVNRRDAVRESPFLLGDIFIEWAAKLYPDKPAVLWDGGSLAYSALRVSVEAKSALLNRIGVSRFQRWGLIYVKCSEFIVSLLALLRLGAVAVPLGTRYPAPRIRLLADRSPF